MRVLAIDPGPTKSAFVLFDGARILDSGIEGNDAVRVRLKRREFGGPGVWTVVEQIEAMGQVAGGDVFETVFWAGRFVECANDAEWDRVTRHAVKLHLCNSRRAKDPNVRQALIDRFGGDEVALRRPSAPRATVAITEVVRRGESAGWWVVRLACGDVRVIQQRAMPTPGRRVLCDVCTENAKTSAGPLFGVASHVWSALGVAVTWWDLKRPEVRASGDLEDGSCSESARVAALGVEGR